MSFPRFLVIFLTPAGALATVGAAEATESPTNDPQAAATFEFEAGFAESLGRDTQWEQVVPGGDCACADGSEWAFWVRDADPSKVVFFLDGGGACWDATTCAFTTEDSTTYDWNVAGQGPSEGGVFDTTTAENPFRDYTYVFVP